MIRKGLKIAGLVVGVPIFLFIGSAVVVGVWQGVVESVDPHQRTAKPKLVEAEVAERSWDAIQTDASTAILRVSEAAFDVGQAASPGGHLRDVLAQACAAAHRVRDEAKGHLGKPIESTDDDTVLALNGALRQCGVLADRHRWNGIRRDS